MRTQLARFSKQVFDNNHWNLTTNIEVGPEYIDAHAAPVAVPRHIGEPSLIKYVFLVIKENRTYDQMLGDVAWGDGDPSLAIFASGGSQSARICQTLPNARQCLRSQPPVGGWSSMDRDVGVLLLQ